MICPVCGSAPCGLVDPYCPICGGHGTVLLHPAALSVYEPAVVAIAVRLALQDGVATTTVHEMEAAGVTCHRAPVVEVEPHYPGRAARAW